MSLTKILNEKYVQKKKIRAKIVYKMVWNPTEIVSLQPISLADFILIYWTALNRRLGMVKFVRCTAICYYWPSIGISWVRQNVLSKRCNYHTNICNYFHKRLEISREKIPIFLGNFVDFWCKIVNVWHKKSGLAYLIAVESAQFFSISLLICCCIDKIISFLARNCIFKWLIVSSWASKIARHSSMLSEYAGGSSKQKKSRTGCDDRNVSLAITELINNWRPRTRLLRNKLLKLSPNSFLRGNMSDGNSGNVDLSLLLRRWKSVYRRNTSQQSFVNGFSTRSL